jgi:hypothetical protein
MALMGAGVAGAGLPTVSRSSGEVRVASIGAWGGRGASWGHGEPIQGSVRVKDGRRVGLDVGPGRRC